jgi:pimeloyl-ACP methyl ester carboxylesterase
VAPWLSFERHLRILRAMWEQRVGDVFPRVKVPVLLLPCDDGSSAWVERKRAEVANAEAGLPVSRTHWFAAEHDVHAQHPDQVAAVLAAALEDGFFA